MKRLELNITALAPLAIGRQKPGGSISEVEHYIPGGVIRGAVAAKILHQAKQQTDLPDDLSQQGGDFQALFLDDQAAIFQNAYPAVADINEEESHYVEEPIYVMPATAVAAKNDGGFKLPNRENQKSKGVFDTLLDRLCADACGHLYDPSSLDCSRVEPISGFYSEANGYYRSHRVNTRFLTRVGINRRRATAQDEQLYSIEVLNESFLPNAKSRFNRWEYMGYRGYLWVPTEKDPELCDRIANFLNGFGEHFRLGGSASRGLGKVKIEVKPAPDPPELKHRIDNFNQALQRRWQQWANLFLTEEQTKDHEISKRTFFTLDLQSDAILRDRWQPATVITPEVLLAYARRWPGQIEVPSDIKLHAAYSSYDYRTGWNAAWGLKKDMELVTNKGSVYLLSIPSKQLADWLPILEILEQVGIGERTPEGFGQVHICNQFHTIFREEAV